MITRALLVDCDNHHAIGVPISASTSVTDVASFRVTINASRSGCILVSRLWK